MPSKADRVHYQDLKRKAAQSITRQQTPREQRDILEAQRQLFNRKGWEGRPIFLKKREENGKVVQRFSTTRSFLDVLTGRDVQQSRAALAFLRSEIAQAWQSHPDAGVRAAADELLTKALADEQKPLADGGKLRPGTVAHYPNETGNYRVFRDALRRLAGAVDVAGINGEARKNVDATGVAKKETPANQQPGVGEPVTPKSQPTAPANAPERKVSLYGPYPDPVDCSPAPQNGRAQSPRPVVAMVDANDRRNVHTNASTPAAILKSLLNQSGNESRVLRTRVDNGGAVYVEAIPSADNPVTGAPHPADKTTCVLLSNVARDYLSHSDPTVRSMAEKLRTLALRSHRENRAIRNGPGLHKILAALTSQPQPQALTPKPVAQTVSAPKRVTPWVTCGAYTSGNPPQLELKHGALTQLINVLAKTPKNSVLEVGIAAHSGQVSVRARYPLATNVEPYGETTDEATRQFFLDLIRCYRTQNKDNHKVVRATGQLYHIVSRSDRQGQGQKAISNSQELQEILTVLAGAG